MIRFIIVAALCYILFRLLKSILSPAPRKPGKGFTQPRGTITDEMVNDPQCQVYIPKRDAFTARVAGETLYFCSKECRKRYLEGHRESR